MITRQIAGVVLSALLLAACGGEPASPTANAPTTAPAAEATSAPTAAIATAQPEVAATAEATSAPAAASGGSALPADWKPYTVDAAGFSVALPGSWQQIDLNPSMIDQTVKSLQDSNPQLAQIYGAQLPQLIASGVKFLGVDPAGAEGERTFATNLNIVAQPLPTALSLEQYTTITSGQISSQIPGVGEIKQTPLTLANHEATELTYSYPLTDAAGNSVQLTLVQYLIVRDTNAYVMTFTAPAEQMDSYTPVFKQIADSFKLS